MMPPEAITWKVQGKSLMLSQDGDTIR